MRCMSIIGDAVWLPREPICSLQPVLLALLFFFAFAFSSFSCSLFSSIRKYFIQLLVDDLSYSSRFSARYVLMVSSELKRAIVSRSMKQPYTFDCRSTKDSGLPIWFEGFDVLFSQRGQSLTPSVLRLLLGRAFDFRTTGGLARVLLA